MFNGSQAISHFMGLFHKGGHFVSLISEVYGQQSRSRRKLKPMVSFFSAEVSRRLNARIGDRLSEKQMGERNGGFIWQ